MDGLAGRPRTPAAQGCVIPAHPLALTAGRRLDTLRQRALSRTTWTPARAGSRSACTPRSSPSARLDFTSRCCASLPRPPKGAARCWLPARSAGRSRRCARRRPRAGWATARCCCRWRHGRVRARMRCSRTARRSRRSCRCSASISSPRWAACRFRSPSGGVRRDRQRRGDQDRALRPLRDARSAGGISAAGAEDASRLHGNNDHIVADLLTPFALRHEGPRRTYASSADCSALVGLDRAAVELHARCRAAPERSRGAAGAGHAGDGDRRRGLRRAHRFRGVTPARRGAAQGLLEGVWCLDPDESLSPGKARRSRRSPSATRTSRTTAGPRQSARWLS